MARLPSGVLSSALMLTAVLCSSKPCGGQDVNTLSNGPLGYWKFESSIGAEVPDYSGHGNDGEIFPAAAASLVQRSGAFAGALSFVGDSSHFVRISPTPLLNSLRKQITVVALIYPTTLWKPPTPFRRRILKLRQKWYEVVYYIHQMLAKNPEDQPPDLAPTGFAAIVQRQWRETRHPDQFYLGYGLRNKVLHYKWHIALTDGSDISLYCLPNGEEKPRSAEWVQLAGTYDGISGRMSLYVNGKLIGSLAHPGEIRLDAESRSRPITIGAELNGPSTDQGNGEFSGYIHDVRLYNRALSDDEIKVLAAEAEVRLAQ
jgi:hypothetical protein